jgi:hypothetical protein
LVYAWDTDGDNAFDDAVTSVNTFTDSFPAGSRTIRVRVTAPDGRSTVQTTTLVVS